MAGQPVGGGQFWTYAASAWPGVVLAGSCTPALRNALSMRSVISLTTAPASGFFAIGKDDVIASDIGPVDAVAADTGAVFAATLAAAGAVDGAGIGEALAATVVVGAEPICGV